jgi:hypothetical protein
MNQEYKIKIHTDDMNASKKIMGIGLIDMLRDSIDKLKNNFSHSSFMSSDSPFFPLKKSDFEINDPIVERFFEHGNLEKVVAMNHEQLIKVANDLQNHKRKIIATSLRVAFNSLKNMTDRNDEAVKLERIASKTSQQSSGYWQIRALENIDNALKASNVNEIKSLNFARELVLTGNTDYIKSASTLIKTVFDSNAPSKNIKVAYTSLSTQDNEPFLLCPKGNFQGKGAVPMEVSKCRDNCIDSRVSKDGIVTCAYQEWLESSFEPQNKVLSRLDTTRHPDNEENSLNLKDGERSKKLSEGEFGYEFRLDRNDRGSNAVRYKQDHTKSIETQISTNKPSEWGHQQNDQPAKRSKKAQSDTGNVITNQLENKRTNDVGLTAVENLLRKLNNIDSDHDSTREELLSNDGLQARRGEMAESYSTQLNEEFDEDPINYRDELNKEKSQPSESISNLLNKTANKKEPSKEEILEESRRNIKTEDTKEEQLAERRTKKYSDESIEKLLDSNEDWGHQFSEKDIKHFSSMLGLDSHLEDGRNSYKLKP